MPYIYLLCIVVVLSLLYKTVSELFVIDNNLLPASDDVKPKSEKDRLKEILPALCRPDDPEPKVCRFITDYCYLQVMRTTQDIHF